MVLIQNWLIKFALHFWLFTPCRSIILFLKNEFTNPAHKFSVLLKREGWIYLMQFLNLTLQDRGLHFQFWTAHAFCFSSRFVDVDTKKIPLPTHFYVILIRCQNPLHQSQLASCPVGDLDIMSFILPNIPSIPNCMVGYLLCLLTKINMFEKIEIIAFIMTVD